MEAIKHFPIPVHKVLQHLNDDQRNDVAEMYFIKKKRPKDICKKYKIDFTHYATFKKLVSLREIIENSCPIHNVYAHQKYKDGYEGWGVPYCPECKEPMYSVLSWDYFKPRNEIDFTWIEKKHLKTISNTLKFTQYLDFSLGLKAFIVVWYLENPEYETNTLKAHWLDNIKICPTEQMKDEFLYDLHQAGLLKKNQYLLQEIEFDKDLKESFEKREFQIFGEAEDHFNLWWDIAYHEVMEYYIYQMTDSNFKVHLGPKTRDTLKFLIQQMSVQMSFYAVWRGVRDGERVLARNNGDYLYASNSVPGAIKKRADQLLDGSLKPTTKFNRSKAFCQSKISEYFCNTMTNLGEREFTIRPNLNIFGVPNTKKRDKDGYDDRNDNVRSLGEIMRDNEFRKSIRENGFNPYENQQNFEDAKLEDFDDFDKNNEDDEPTPF